MEMDIKNTFFIYSLRKFNNTRANFNSKKIITLVISTF